MYELVSTMARCENSGKLSESSQSSKDESTGGVQAIHGGMVVDNPSLQITTVKLDDLNYLTRFRYAIFSIQSRGL